MSWQDRFTADPGVCDGETVIQDPSWEADFEAAARRPLELRLRYAFIKTRRPVLDDVPYRSFDSLEDYRCWCERHLPDWLGYARV